MDRRALLALLVAPCLAAAAPVQHDLAVVEAIQSYEEGAYAAAVERLEAALAKGLAETSERTLARSYLASAQLSLKDEGRARATLAAMIADDPAATVDPSIFPPRLLQLLEEARRAAGRPAPKPEPKPESDLPRVTVAPPPPVFVPPPPRREAPSLALAFVPFGVGQFTNGSPKKGAFFLGSELLAYGTFAVALGVFESKKLPGSPGPFQCTDANPCRFASSSDERWQPVYLAALYTGIALTVAGIVEAIVENRSIASESEPAK